MTKCDEKLQSVMIKNAALTISHIGCYELQDLSSKEYGLIMKKAKQNILEVQLKQK